MLTAAAITTPPVAAHPGRFAMTPPAISPADDADALERALRERIRHFLAEYLHDAAVFLAERLLAENRSEENAHVLATCCLRAGRANRAIAVLENAKRPANRYLLAVCCLQQNRLVEAENALLGTESGRMVSAAMYENVPNGACGLYLLGRVCRRAGRRQPAIDCFVRALELDATLWSAFEELCDLGANLEASRFFGANSAFTDAQGPDRAVKHVALHQEDELDSFVDDDHISYDDDRFRTPQVCTAPALATPQNAPSTFNTPRIGVASSQMPFRTPVPSSTPLFGSPQEILKKPRVGTINAPPNMRLRKTYRRPLIETDEKQRRNARLSFSSAVSEGSPQDFGKQDSNVTPYAARLFQSNNSPKKKSDTDKSIWTQHEGHTELLQLLASFGMIYHKLSLYMCRDAIMLIQRLPPKQRASSWAQHQLGRAHFELADYNEAHEVFKQMYQVDYYRMAGLDVYSTTLWHLKKEVDLSYLAQQATDFDKLSPEAWCAAGNCFSLQKEHDTALAFFQRAIQLDPHFTYAYTLSGHEYVANEDFEKAINCYRHAIRVDPRHYNAWYGLGTIYYRQEKFEFAEYHFRRALEINPRSSLLHCFLGMVLHSRRQYDEALEMLSIAGELQPLNPQARFQRANVLMTLHRFEEALDELEHVRNFAPRESSVHFMMGKVSKKLGRLDDAMRCFTTALYFHPKDNNVIKSAIDKINEPDLEDDDRL